jgi:two-component flavin-dependent monooxygenase
MHHVLPARSDVAAAAGCVKEVAAAHAGAAEDGRRLEPEVIDAITEAGFARHFVPTRWGGRAGTFRAAADASALVAEGHMSAGWCASLYANHARLAVHLPLDGQAEIWADGPDARISMSVLPSGQVVPVDGGWVLTGGWGFTSGVDYADWTLLVATAPGDERQDLFFAVPRRDYAVKDTWFNVGLRGTGSKTVLVDRVFVPDHRTFPRKIILDGQMIGSAARCHAVPFKLINGLALTAPALGAVRAALSAWTAWMTQKRDGSGRPARDIASVQDALARASAATDSAQLLLERTAGTADSGPINASVVARGGRDSAIVAELLTAAVDRLFRAGGARGQGSGSPIERAWRDVNAAAGHAALRFDINAAAYAEQVLGDGG